MPVESAIARVGGKPGGEEAAARVRIATLVTDMREPVRGMGVLLVQRYGSLDLRTSGPSWPSSDSAVAW